MWSNLFVGFITASLVQAGMIMLGEYSGITALNAQLDIIQLITHVITGLVAGYILYFLVWNFQGLRTSNYYLVGAVYGLLLWPIVLGIAATQGKVNPPLQLNIVTIIWSMLAFAIYGIIATYSIHNYGLNDTTT